MTDFQKWWLKEIFFWSTKYNQHTVAENIQHYKKCIQFVEQPENYEGRLQELGQLFQFYAQKIMRFIVYRQTFDLDDDLLAFVNNFGAKSKTEDFLYVRPYNGSVKRARLSREQIAELLADLCAEKQIFWPWDPVQANNSQRRLIFKNETLFGQVLSRRGCFRTK